MTRGEKLKIYRTGLGLSQEKVAELVGVSRQAVTKWENNQAAPSTENLIALASLYHVSLDELVADRPHERKKDPQILHANLTLIAIILQASWLNVAMRPLPETDHPSIRVAGWVIQFVPLLAASIWMAFNLRYEKNAEQFRKNTRIELLYCLVQVAVALFGHYSRMYFLAALLLIAVALFYIFVVNPRSMNRRLTRKWKEKKR